MALHKIQIYLWERNNYLGLSHQQGSTIIELLISQNLGIAWIIPEWYNSNYDKMPASGIFPQNIP